PPGPCAVSILPQFFDRARATTAPEQRDAPHPKSRRPVLSSRAAPTELLSSLAHLTTVAGRDSRAAVILAARWKSRSDRRHRIGFVSALSRFAQRFFGAGGSVCGMPRPQSHLRRSAST